MYGILASRSDPTVQALKGGRDGKSQKHKNLPSAIVVNDHNIYLSSSTSSYFFLSALHMHSEGSSTWSVCAKNAKCTHAH